VDVRNSANPVLAGGRRWLDRVNARHPWNHNEHFHGWILRHLPARPHDRPAAGQPVMPVRDPATTLAEITAAARARLPGAAVRRRLFFRYTLRWDKPLLTPPGPGWAM
jgi:hypothetical protein